MSELWIVIIIVNAFDLLLFGGIGLFILKNEKIYLKEEGRWMPGLNLPRLYSEPGDVVNHDGFRKHVGWAIINFGILFSIALTGFVFILENELINETATIGLSLLVIFGLVLYLVYVLFTKSERYIERNTSKRIRYDIYLFRMMIATAVLTSAPLFFGTENMLTLIIVSMFLTTVVVVYYIYKIYVLLKENKKDFL